MSPRNWPLRPPPVPAPVMHACICCADMASSCRAAAGDVRGQKDTRGQRLLVLVSPRAIWDEHAFSQTRKGRITSVRVRAVRLAPGGPAQHSRAFSSVPYYFLDAAFGFPPGWAPPWAASAAARMSRTTRSPATDVFFSRRRPREPKWCVQAGLELCKRFGQLKGAPADTATRRRPRKRRPRRPSTCRGA